MKTIEYKKETSLSLHFNAKLHYSYIIDLKSKESMQLYYATKNRFDYSLKNRDCFYNDLVSTLKKSVKEFDFVVIPESSKDFIKDIAEQLNKKVYILHKNNKKYIEQQLHTLHLQKAELQSHKDRILEMGDSFKINMLKANQRRKYKELLFNKVNDIPVNQKGIILDDSYFSGITIESMRSITNIKDVITIFSK